MNKNINNKNDCIVLLKFCKEKQYAKDIFDGRLYGNTIEFYKKLEDNYNNDIQGDSDEVTYKEKTENLHLLNEKTALKTKITKEYRYTDDDKIPVVCFMGFKIEELKYEDGHYSFPFNDNEINLFKKEFGEYCVMCYKEDIDVLLKEYCTNRFETKYDYNFKKITYMDMSSQEYKEIFESGTSERFFYKNTKYSYQHEYRIVIGMDILNSESRYIEIGNIKSALRFNADKLKELKFILKELKFILLDD
ncbi:hypothetical protein [Peptostreptococcus porci]|uniref:hypothetical protein n=1 Tax=Peptostreptococcus porci TaxID=2652282 RepID=UPI002A9154C5|nr:hypothetical protein [Peptostreptococcus porci]MDY6231927.1 hypothetical protein [Peptostreptococcus porci]